MNNRYRLHYSLTLLTDASFPLDAYDDTYDCIPGREIRKAVNEKLDGNLGDAVKALTFSFAYIESCGRRFMPSPVSFAFVRKAPSQLRDRIAFCSDSDLFERLHYLPHCYVADPDAETIETMSVRQTVVNNNRIICSKQTFNGFVEGDRDVLESIAELLSNDGSVIIGSGNASFQGLSLSQNVFGPVSVSDITLRVISPMIFRNQYGVYDETEVPVIRALESILQIKDVLSLKSMYRETCRIHMKGFPASYGTAPGSVFHITCAGKQDISVVRHCFIGCNTADGYGEILVSSANNLYCRTLLKKSEEPR